MFGIALAASGATPDFWQMVDRAAAFEDARSIAALGYPAHLSLAVYDAIDPADLATAIHQLAGEPSLTLRFTRIAMFDVEPLVLWLAPVPDDRLMALHAAVHSAIGPERSTPYYRPGTWVTHCTLATRIAPRHRDAALAFARKSIEPIDIVFDRLDAVAFPPVSVLSTQPLSD